MASNARPPIGPTQSRGGVGQTSSGAKAAAMTAMAKQPLQRQPLQPNSGVAVSRTKTDAYPSARSTTKPTPTQAGGGTVQRTTAAARPAPPQQPQSFKKGGKVKPPQKPKKR